MEVLTYNPYVSTRKKEDTSARSGGLRKEWARKDMRPRNK
jgi:hypothetical protein